MKNYLSCTFVRYLSLTFFNFMEKGVFLFFKLFCRNLIFADICHQDGNEESL